MKRILTLSTIAFAATMISCGPTGPQTIKGQIVDASMNVITISTDQGDTLSFSSMDVAIESPEGILLGDSAQITYNAPLSKEANTLTLATRIVVTPIAPRTQTNILGRWVQPIAGMDGVQGVEFREDGTAASINMATLVYKTWSMDGDTLRMTGQSIGNGQTIDFTQNATIEMPNSDSLILTVNGNSESLTREK